MEKKPVQSYRYGADGLVLDIEGYGRVVIPSNSAFRDVEEADAIMDDPNPELNP